jgi:hypothetical protein
MGIGAGRSAEEVAEWNAMEDAMQRATIPEFARSYDGLVVDSEGWIWLREALHPWRELSKSTRWWVFDERGALAGAVRLPAFDVESGIEIGLDYVLGTALDALDQPQVQLFRLHRGR